MVHTISITRKFINVLAKIRVFVGDAALGVPEYAYWHAQRDAQGGVPYEVWTVSAIAR
jgi:hypothetical protein